MHLQQIRLGVVALSVADLQRSVHFYTDPIGLRVHHQDDTHAILGSDQPLLRLYEQKGARRVARASGLFHCALRVPTRTALAQIIAHFIEQQTPLAGTADHLVSEALYLSDPDGHGIEIYWDRPRDGWFDPQGNLQMGTLALDMDALLEAGKDDVPWCGLPDATDMGHVHLQVSDLATANVFYLDVLGFELMAGMSSASFISADRYHHHLGLNTWASRNQPYAPDDAARLLYATIVMPETVLAGVRARLENAHVPVTPLENGLRITDPSGIVLHLVTVP